MSESGAVRTLSGTWRRGGTMLGGSSGPDRLNVTQAYTLVATSDVSGRHLGPQRFVNYAVAGAVFADLGIAGPDQGRPGPRRPGPGALRRADRGPGARRGAAPRRGVVQPAQHRHLGHAAGFPAAAHQGARRTGRGRPAGATTQPRARRDPCAAVPRERLPTGGRGRGRDPRRAPGHRTTGLGDRLRDRAGRRHPGPRGRWSTRCPRAPSTGSSPTRRPPRWSRKIARVIRAMRVALSTPS